MDRDTLLDKGEQSAEKKPAKEKERTIGDMINLPRDEHEMKIAAAAKSGLLNPSELEQASKQKADAAGVNQLIGVLENRAAEKSRDIDLPKLREELVKEVAKVETDQQVKDREESQQKPKDGYYGVLKEMQEKMSEVTEVLKRAGVHSEKNIDDELKPQKTIVTPEVQKRKEEEAKNITKLHPRDGG